MTKIINRILKKFANALMERYVRYIEENRQHIMLLRRPVRPGDGLPGKETAITYEFHINGKVIGHWNPYELLEDVSILTKAGNLEIMDSVLRARVFSGFAQETRMAYTDDNLIPTMKVRPSALKENAVQVGYGVKI